MSSRTARKFELNEFSGKKSVVGIVYLLLRLLSRDMVEDDLQNVLFDRFRLCVSRKPLQNMHQLQVRGTLIPLRTYLI